MQWQRFSPIDLKAIKVTVLIASGDHDFGWLEQSLEISRLIRTAQLAIAPGPATTC